MTNWEKFIQTRHIKEGHSDVAAFELTPEDFKWLKKACIKAKKESLKHNNSLVGHIKEEYKITKCTNSFNKFLNIECTSHANFLNFLNKLNILSNAKPYYLDSFWCNFMKKHEFNPVHTHEGLFSFVIFVQIPYSLKKEENYFGEVRAKEEIQTSKFNFLNTDHHGRIITTSVNVDKSFEGKMIMFPSHQTHLVYPFYTSNKYRITVSGNIKLKV
jgi:hypothetical protein